MAAAIVVAAKEPVAPRVAAQAKVGSEEAVVVPHDRERVQGPARGAEKIRGGVGLVD